MAYGGMFYWDRHNRTNSPQPLANIPQEVNHVITEPDETPIDTRQEYSVPSDQPRSITIGSAQIHGFVQRVATEPNGAIAVPSNIHLAGWYVDSQRPGESGLSIIDGHVSGRYADAIFKDLHATANGDRITVEFGDLRTVEFEIVDKHYSPADQAAAILTKKRAEIDAQLNLITCSGTYDAEEKTFDERLIVVARKI